MRYATLNWSQGLSFNASSGDSPAIVVDGDGKGGPSPMVTLLMAIAGCSGADVVSILEKMRVQLRTCRIEISGQRADQDPRRYVALTLRFHLAGGELAQAQADRAVELSVTKYCSVLKSLDPGIEITTETILE